LRPAIQPLFLPTPRSRARAPPRLRPAEQIEAYDGLPQAPRAPLKLPVAMHRISAVIAGNSRSDDPEGPGRGTFGKHICEHPQYNAAAFAAQKRLGEIQGRRHTWFCGAWTGYGFHEDGLSGLAVAEALGGVTPWREPPPELAQAAE
jgi:predicted NAD/FAD-binding protein